MADGSENVPQNNGRSRRKQKSKDVRRAFEHAVKQELPAQTAVLAENTFYFQQRRGRLDLRAIARIDIERVIADVDIDTLQSNLESIAFSDLDADDLSHYSDEHFVTLFRLAQLIIEYLLNVQNALLTYSKDAESETARLEAAAKEGELRLKSRKKQMESLRREIKQNRRTIKTYEEVLRQKTSEQRHQAKEHVVDFGGRKFVAIDYVRAKYQGRTRENGGQERDAAARAEEEARRAADERARLQLAFERRELEQAKAAQEKEFQFKAELEEAQKVKLELEKERALREAAEKKAELALQHEAEKLKQQTEELKKKFQVQMDRMKEHMEQKMAELSRRQISNLEGKAGMPAESAAGDLESDSDDEEDAIHDRVSWGAMRKSRKEMEEAMNAKDIELKKAQEAAAALKLESEKAAALKVQLAKEKVKRERLEATVEETRQREQAMADALKAAENRPAPAPPASVEEEVPTEYFESIGVAGTAPMEPLKTFFPMYEWKKVPADHAAFHQEHLETRDGPPMEVKIPLVWQLELPLEGGQNGAPASANIQIRREMTVREVLEDAGAQLGIRADQLCLIYRPHEEGAEDFQNAEAGAQVPSTETAEHADLFNRRPRLCRVEGLTDTEVDRLVKRYQAAKKDPSKFTEDIQEQMELLDSKISRQKKAELALANEKKPRRRFPVTAAEHEGILAQYNHSRGDIAAMIEQIENEQIPREFVHHDIIDEGEDMVDVLDAEDYEELMEMGWHLSKHYKKTTTDTVEQELEASMSKSMEKDRPARKELMDKKLQDLDNKLQALRTKHEGMLSAAMESWKSRSKEMSTEDRKLGIRSMFTKMHSMYFSKLLKPDIVSRTDVINEQNIASSGGKRGGSGVLAAVGRAFGNMRKKPSDEKKEGIHNRKQGPPAEVFDDEGSSGSDDSGLTEDEDSEIEGTGSENASDDEEGEEPIKLNESLRQDLDSTTEMDQSFGTGEIVAKADEYEAKNKPTDEQLRLSYDLAREAEQEMMRRQGAIAEDLPAGTAGLARMSTVMRQIGEANESIKRIPHDEDVENDSPQRSNQRDRASPVEEDEDDLSDWDDDDDSMALSPTSKSRVL